ncbi:hypothetical protein OG430_26690 [Streptomyces sp. NBC_01304]|nr:hypothetical protein OG430_26690 [Streptomyces sp. NBC_01304]
MTAGAVASLMWATSGCSGSGAAAEDEKGEAVAVLRAAADVLVDAGSSKARTSMEMATGGTRVTIRGEGTYDFKRQIGELRVLLPQDPSGAVEHRPITELLAPGALYMKNRGAGVPDDKWVRVDTATLSDGNLVTGGATDPLAAAELLRGASEVTYVGESKVDGVAVRRYRGTADIARAAQLASAHNRKVFAAAAKGFAKGEVPFEAYVDEQGRLRKIRHQFSFVNSAAGGSGGRSSGSGAEVAVASTTLLYGFGTPVKAQLPDAEDIFAGKIAEG